MSWRYLLALLAKRKREFTNRAYRYLLAYWFNRDRRPLDGLKIFITHIKESLVPHPEGKTQHEIIMAQLQELEKDGKLGVVFIRPAKGDRIGAFSWCQADYNEINADAE